MLVKDYEKWTPFTSAAVSDIAITTHTSLGDEILAIGKPVIFYDFTRFTEIVNYGSEVISYTIEDVKSKLRSFIQNPEKYNENLNSIRKRFYTVTDISPRQLLKSKLIEIYSKS